MPRRRSAALIALGVVVGVTALTRPSDVDTGAVDFSAEEIRRILQHAPLGPVPDDPTNAVAEDPRAVHLGQYLFFDPRLSGTGEISCATCHDPQMAFADGRPVAEGHGVGPRNTPGLWNVAWNRWYFWDGRADTLWSQAIQPLERDVEMSGNRLAIAHVVHEAPELRQAYEAIFGPLPPLDDHDRFPPAGRPLPGHPEHPHHVAWTSMTPSDQEAVNRILANLGKTLAAYQRRIVSDDSPFDTFAEGLRDGDREKLAALGPAAQRGLKLFIGAAGCRLCHSGPNFTDGEFHNIGIPPGGEAGALPLDSGRYGGVPLLRSDPFRADGPFSDATDAQAARRSRTVANNPDNWGRFKTPSLRHAAETAPYMHQGQLATLDEVLRFYSTLEDAVQLDHHRESVLAPLNLEERQLEDLRMFLRSLTGRPLPGELLEQPEEPLPTSDG